MPFEMHWEPQGVHTRFFGTVTAADLLHHVQDVCHSANFDDLRFSIIDFREATDAVSDPELLPVRANLVGAQYTNPNIFVAAIATDEMAVAHLRRFASLGVLRKPMQVFATTEDAEDWIAAQTHSLQPGRSRH